MLMLERKRVAYRTVELPTGAHPWLVRALGFAGHRTPIRSVEGSTPRMLALLDRGGTVPALRIDGQRVQTNGEIAKYLDRTRPRPPLLPDDDDELAAQVREAQLWGDEVLQMAARRLVLAASSRGLLALRGGGGEGPLGALLASSARVRAISSRSARVVFRADRAGEAKLLEELPDMLDRVDAWIAAGVLDGAQPNVADFTIAPSLALLSYREDARAQILARPAASLVARFVPEPAASAPGVL
jgi:glutathione S-transferase